MVFDITKPQTQTRLNSTEIRDNFSAVGRASDLKCFAQTVPDLTVLVQPGRFSTVATTSIVYTGGSSPTVDTTTGGLPGQERIVVVEITDAGVIGLNYGSWASAGAAVAPSYTASNIALCEVLLEYNDQSITNDMITDVRPLINLGTSGELIAPDLVTIIATDALGPGLGQQSFDTSSSFTFVPGASEVLVWSGGVFQTPSVDYDEPSNSTVRFNIARPAGERVTIWKIGISASPGTLGLAELTDVSADQADAFQNANAPTALNPFLTTSGHGAIDHSTIAPIPTLLAHLTTSSAHDAVDIDSDTSTIAYSSASDIQGVLEDVDDNVYQIFLQQHTAAGEHGPEVTINQTGAANALSVTKSGTDSFSAQVIINQGAGYGLHVQNSGSSSGVRINQNSNQHGLVVDQTGIGRAVSIEHSSDEAAIYVVHGADSHNALYMNVLRYGMRIDVQSTTTASNGWGAYINQAATGSDIIPLRLTQAGDNTALLISQDGDPETSGAILIQQNNTGSGRAFRIDQSGSGNTIYLNKSTTTGGTVVKINNAGSGSDIEGHSARWSVNNSGSGRFANVVPGGGTGVATGWFIMSRGADIVVDNYTISPTHSYHRVQRGSGAAHTTTIRVISTSGTEVGAILVLTAVDNSSNVTVENRGTGGNIDLNTDFVLDHSSDTLTLMRIERVGDWDWVEIARTNNA